MIDEIDTQKSDATTILVLSIIAITLQSICFIAYWIVCGMKGTKPASYQY